MNCWQRASHGYVDAGMGAWRKRESKIERETERQRERERQRARERDRDRDREREKVKVRLMRCVDGLMEGWTDRLLDR